MDKETGKNLKVTLTEDEMLVISNALNAVCNGPYAIDEWEFRALIGVDKQKTKQLLAKISKIFDES